MVERAQQASFAVHGQIARRPDCWRADVAGKNRILGSQFVEQANDVLRMDRLCARSLRCKLIESFSGLLVTLERIFQMLVVFVLPEFWQKGPKSGLRIPDKAIV